MDENGDNLECLPMTRAGRPLISGVISEVRAPGLGSPATHNYPPRPRAGEIWPDLGPSIDQTRQTADTGQSEATPWLAGGLWDRTGTTPTTEM